jgi:hypothetical protein
VNKKIENVSCASVLSEILCSFQNQKKNKRKRKQDAQTNKQTNKQTKRNKDLVMKGKVTQPIIILSKWCYIQGFTFIMLICYYNVGLRLHVDDDDDDDDICIGWIILLLHLSNI